MFITDTFIIEDLKILEESKATGTMRIAGVFQRANIPNQNKRIYEKKILVRELGRLDEAVKERRLMGELDHPSHEVLNTPSGQVAQALIRGGVKLGISSRGMGTLTERQDGMSVVNGDYKLVTFDLVADPSTEGAFPGLVSEGKDSAFIENTIKKTYDKALSEKVFITLLRNKLNKK
mgnify:CR=1 FL=1